jgi:decaprenylphospho-beta-D-ribofuranose 2-oxidase
MSRMNDGVDRTLRRAPLARMELTSFDGGVQRIQEVMRPDRYRHLEALPAHAPRIVRGGGYSYAAASFGSDAIVQDYRRFDRILALDEASGVVECEAGTTLGRVFEVAGPRGWYLATQPGYPQITIGGCIAADIHGKNQYRDGTFSGQVESLRLFHPRHGFVTASASENAALFKLTCGGLGLTGHILSARLRLSRLPGHRARIRRVRLACLESTPPLLDEAASRATFVYTWHNFSARGAAFGRGYLYEGDFVTAAGRETKGSCSHIDSESRARFVPRTLGGLTTRTFNLAYEMLQGVSPSEKEIGLYQLLFPVAHKVAYYRLFGRKGFHECQLLIPRDEFERCAVRLREYLAAQPVPVTLASAKLFRGTQDGLRFDGNGVCLALDFPRGPSGTRFATWLDSFARDVGALPNLIKDSRLSRETVQACYRDYDVTREALHKHDPERLYRSELSERLGL